MNHDPIKSFSLFGLSVVKTRSLEDLERSNAVRWSALFSIFVTATNPTQPREGFVEWARLRAGRALGVVK